MPRLELAVGETALEWRRPPRVRVWYPTDSVAGSAQFPVVLYFPGWPGTDVDNRALIKSLAARGFVVAALTYTDRTAMDYSSAAACRKTVELADRRVAERARDAVDLLDELYKQTGDPGSHFAQRLDPYNAGIMGFSFGGAIAAEASSLDARIRAVINVDGRHWGNALEHGVTKPYLFIGEELVVPGTADFTATDPDRRHNAALDLHDYTQLAANLRRHGGTQVVVRNALHMNFCDEALRGRWWRRRRDLGSIAPARALEILNAHVIEFFERHLKRPHSAPAATAPEFPETRVEHWPSPHAAGGVQTR